MPHDNEQDKPDDFLAIFEVEEVTHKDEQIEELQQALVEERDARREDRFFFIVVCVFLLNVVFFSVMDNLGGPIALLILELLVLFPLARRMGLEEAATMINRVLGRMASDLKDRD